MECIKFITLIPKYFESDLDSQLKIEMDNHIKNCHNCREALEKRKELLETFKYILMDEEIPLKSRKDEILSSINKSKYTGSILNKSFYHLYFKKNAFIGVAAAVFLIFIAYKYGGNIYTTAVQYTTNTTEKNVAVDESAEKVVPIVKPVITSTVKIEFSDVSKDLMNPTGDGISSSVNPTSRKKLVEMLKEMKQLSQGVGPWRVIYCNNGSLMFYNYGHIIAYKYNEKEKGIYSILDFRGLKVGSYQGSEVTNFNFSPDGNYVLLGTFNGLNDSDKSLYIYDLNKDIIKEIATNFSMNSENIIWYNTLKSPFTWKVSAKDDKNTVIWDVDNAKALGELPIEANAMDKNDGKFLNSEDLNFTDDKGNTTKLVIENYTESYWFKDDNTLIGVQYMEGSENINLGHFQIVEINISDKTGKITFRP